jgi:ferric-dicitrate binding protein FerR (iron transport regulator)
MLYSVEDLVVNDSFIAYCMQQDAGDRSFWDEYLEQHPEALPAVEEARLLVLGLKLMLQKKQNELSAGEDKAGHALYLPEAVVQPLNPAGNSSNRVPGKRKQAWAVAAVACVVIALGVFYQSRQPVAGNRKGIERIASSVTPVQSKAGELKTLVLPDNSTITLNMGSSLKLSEGFSRTNRDVYLVGEAFFDVTHNKNLPFIVHVKDYKVKVLGTRFNVKAYKNDRLSETSLLEGSVQIIVDKNGREEVYKTLQVNQKFTIKTDSSALLSNASSENRGEVTPLSYYDEKQAVETAWTKDLLIFEGRSMEEIKNVLERKFGVTITIPDKKVQQYLYSANFTNESIDEILKALQLSYPFSYKKEGNTIIINK